MASTRNDRHCAPNWRRSPGFTLTEMLTVMAIVATLMAIGVPSYRYVTNSNRIASEVNGLLGDMQFARAEAIKEGQTVTVCASADGNSCSGSTSWQTGWIVFSDPTRTKVVDAAHPVLRFQKAFPSGDTFLADNNIQSVTFNREGFALSLPNAATATISLHDATNNAAWTRCLAISIVGMLTTQKVGAGNCA